MGKKKKKVLEGYKREGKRFIPPMKQLPVMREQSYVHDMLPELIWLGLIHDRMGYHFGSATLEAAVELAKGWPETRKNTNLALQSAYSELTQEQKDSLVGEWKRRNLLDDIQLALAPLVLLYDGFSLSFVGPPSVAAPQETLIQRMKDCVGNHLDRRETPAVALHGALMLTRLIAGKIKFAPHIKLPDFNAVFNSPGTEEAQRAAGFMRSNAMAEMSFLELDHDWAIHFWNRGADLAPCELPKFLQADD